MTMKSVGVEHMLKETSVPLTLVNNKKVFLDTESGNLYHYKYAVDNNLARVKCAHCSTVVGTGPDGLIKHMWLYTQARR